MTSNNRCLCKDGYIRDANKKCIKIEDCPATASTTEVPTTTASVCSKDHEIFTNCGSLCAKTCQNKDKTGVCPEICITGCFCETGYVRDDNGDCILPEQCPAIETTQSPTPTCSKAHETYTECGSACPLTCDNKDTEIICTMQCVAGCFCEAGYVRDASGECVLPAECPATTTEAPATESTTVANPCPNPHEIFSACGANGCQNTCANPTFSILCKAGCMPGCVCQDGYIRDDNNFCIKPEQCPATTTEATTTTVANPCPNAHETFSVCGANGCQNTCTNPTLSTVCRAMCIAGCICKNGYIRDANNACILPKNCPTTTTNAPAIP